MKNTRPLREIAILYALFVLPGIMGGAVPSETVPAPMIVYFAAFIALVVYLRDLNTLAGIVPFPVRFSLAGATIPVALGTAAILLALSTVIGIASLPSRPPPLEPDAATILLVILVAVAEEIFFRAHMVHALRSAGMPPAAALVTAAILFSAGHAYQGWGAVIFAALAAIILGLVWLRRRNLSVVIVAHLAYNLTVLLISYR